MKKIIICLFLFQISIASYSQLDKSTFGLGAGLDYGGFGVNATGYLNKNIGIFGGVGYALADVGFNAGFKFRSASESARIAPFFTAMYGYNTAFVVTNATQYNKIFYGPSIGAGVDFRGRQKDIGHWR